MNKKGKFSQKAQRIVKPKTNSISDFLENSKYNTKTNEPVYTGNRKNVKPYTQRDANINKKSKKEQKLKREELKMPFDLAEWLREYAFKNRTTKTTVIIEALEQFRKSVQ